MLIEHVVYCIGVDMYTKIRTAEVFTEHAWFRHCAFTGLASNIVCNVYINNRVEYFEIQGNLKCISTISLHSLKHSSNHKPGVWQSSAYIQPMHKISPLHYHITIALLRTLNFHLHETAALVMSLHGPYSQTCCKRHATDLKS